ncbi:hypothetical protein [Phenylobacterium sp.]|uniref:hypothetical protein n=1 Tax=Phenylobacterium sp. TaxID=1871053 RepID=UPI002737D3BB|nr:hypothetical protein [Phenylobacterium sp.]MDP3869150.1 hypothetical protein [Phenylobacterium sp.]
MFVVTRYCVQPYARHGKRLVAGEPQQFRERGEAMGVSRRMRRRVAGVAVYEVSGWPVYDLWREPRLIEAFGEVPA